MVLQETGRVERRRGKKFHDVFIVLSEIDIEIGIFCLCMYSRLCACVRVSGQW